jgi:PleD family two-component response regulator
MCVVLVDAEGDLGDAVVVPLQEAAIAVFSFRYPQEALAFMEDVFEPCLVIVGVSARGLDDYELTVRTSRHPRLAKLAVLVYTPTPGSAPPGCQAFAKEGEIDALMAEVRARIHHQGLP